MLKNRQSSKTPVNLKRPAPSTSADTEPIIEKGIPRAKTFPTKRIQQSARLGSANRRQKSMDTTQAINNQPVDNGTQSAWMSNTPELLTESMNTPETISSTSLNASLTQQEPSSLAWSQQFNNPTNLPDLMQFMFPSDDPFAYPTQPMSKLEDDHFRHDTFASQFPFDSSNVGMDSNSPGDPSLHSATGSTSGFDSFPTLGNFGPSSGVKSSVPNRLQTSSQSIASPLLGSPNSHSQTTPSEALSSPDLVSIPNQNFVWQGYNFQPTNAPTDQIPQQTQDAPDPNGVQDVNMTFDDNAFGSNADIGVLFDDLFGNEPDYKPGNGASADDWTQWMNTAV